MNSKLFLMAISVIAAFGIGLAVVGPVTTAAPVAAQNITADNATTTAGNVTAAGNATSGNWAK